MEDDGQGEVVRVVSNQNALSEPRFIIQSEGRFYLTLALWEYDPATPNLTSEQSEGLRSIAEDFRQLLDSGQGRQAVKTPNVFRQHFLFGHTGPAK